MVRGHYYCHEGPGLQFIRQRLVIYKTATSLSLSGLQVCASWQPASGGGGQEKNKLVAFGLEFLEPMHLKQMYGKEHKMQGGEEVVEVLHMCPCLVGCDQMHQLWVKPHGIFIIQSEQKPKPTSNSGVVNHDFSTLATTFRAVGLCKVLRLRLQDRSWKELSLLGHLNKAQSSSRGFGCHFTCMGCSKFTLVTSPSCT